MPKAGIATVVISSLRRERQTFFGRTLRGRISAIEKQKYKSRFKIKWILFVGGALKPVDFIRPLNPFCFSVCPDFRSKIWF